MSFTSWEKTICNICIYTYKKLIHLLGWECFLLCTTGNFRIQRHLHYYVGIFYQFLHTNQYFLNTTLILSHTTHTHTQTHTHTHTHYWGFHFYFWTSASQSWSLVIWIIWNIWLSDENLPQKKRAKMKTVISNLD